MHFIEKIHYSKHVGTSIGGYSDVIETSWGKITKSIGDSEGETGEDRENSSYMYKKYIRRARMIAVILK